MREALQVGQTLGIDGPRNNVKLPMLQAFEAATAGWPEDKLHVESFSARQHVPAAGGFNVVLQRAQRTLFVEQGKSILQVLLDAGIDAPHCCQDGVCGACQTAVLEGEPDHHLDSYLSPAR